MKLTKEILKKFEACEDGYDWFIKQKTEDVFKLIDRTIKSKNKEILSYANWGIAIFLNRENKIKYAVYAAKQVLHIFENKYPNDDRPRKAIKATEKYLKKSMEENKNAVIYAAGYADYATDAAYAAINAADDDADAVKIELKIKIIKYGKKLLKKQESK